MPKWSDTAFMLQTPLTMVREFQQAMGQPLDQKHPPIDMQECPEDVSDLLALRRRLISEETKELSEAIDHEPDDHVLKELADLVYVVYGYAATYGWDLDEAVRRVHRSNMSKLGDDGKPIYREDGKVTKGPNYQPPNLKDLV